MLEADVDRTYVSDLECGVRNPLIDVLDRISAALSANMAEFFVVNPDDLQLRDLRRTAATEDASAGATPSELMAVGGWQSLTTIRLYLAHTSEQAVGFQAKREAYRVRCRIRSSV